jgi:hypothetical protein
MNNFIEAISRALVSNNILYFMVTIMVVSFFGYIFCVLKERVDLFNQRIEFKSDSITQDYIDDVEMKSFKLGRKTLLIGDEVKVYLNSKVFIKGVILGAKKSQNKLCLITETDELLELSVSNIRKLKILSKYGRFI